MATTKFDRLMNNIRVHVPGALDGAMQLAIFSALEAFLKGSNAWCEEIAFTTRADRLTYTIQPEYGIIDRLTGVRDTDQTPITASMPVPGEVRLRTQPPASKVYTATVTLTIDDPVTREGWPQVPDWILSKYSDVVLEGALGELMSQPAKPYSNERLGIYHLRRFRNGMAAARAEAKRENLNGGQAWSYPRNFV